MSLFFSNTLFLNVIVCLLFFFFLSLHNLFFDLGSQTVCDCFTALKINFKKETQELSQAVSIAAANLQTLGAEGALRFVFRTLMWRRPGSAWVLLGMSLLLKIKVFSKCEICTACYLHKEISTLQFDIFQSHSLKLHTVGTA